MKSINAEEDISGIKTDVEPMMMNMTMMNRRIKDNTTNVKSLMEQIEQLKGGSLPSIPAEPVKPIEIPQGNIDANQLAQIFAAKDVVANLERRVAQCEATDKQQNDMLGDHEQRIATLEQSMN